MAISFKKYHKRDINNDTSPKKGFDSIMSETVHDMPRHNQLFSRFIHQKTVASASRLLSATLARPNAILLGAIVSFSLTILAYLPSKNLGYSLSGFESIGGFIIGWAAGLFFDALSPLFKKKK